MLRLIPVLLWKKKTRTKTRINVEAKQRLIFSPPNPIAGLDVQITGKKGVQLMGPQLQFERRKGRG